MNKKNIAISAAINLSARVGLGILALVKVILIARAFGASGATDAYMIAIWIPLFVWGTGDSVLVYSLVPYLVSIEVKKGAGSARESTNHVFTLLCVVLLGVAVALYFAAPYIIYVLAPGFSEETRFLSIHLLQLLSPGVFAAGLAAICASLLYAKRRFAVPAIAALLPEMCAIGFLLLGLERWGIQAPALGFLTGVCAQLAILLLALLRLKLVPRLQWSGLGRSLDVAKLMGPRLGGVGLNRAIIGVDRFFASLIGTGSVSVLIYAFRLTQIPMMVVVSAVGKTLMPALSKEIAEGNTEILGKHIPRAIGFVLFVFAPLVLLLIYYSEPIIRIVFERGAFTAETTSLAAKVFVFYAIAIVFQSVAVLFSGIFFATGDTWTPFKITLLSLFLNAALDYLLMNLFGLAGIAMATLGIALVSAMLLYRRLSATIGVIDLSVAFGSFVKIVAATAVMALTVWGLTTLSGGGREDGELWARLFEMGGLSVLSWGVFLIACRMMGLHEYFTVETMVGKKLGWQK